jgi:hypothetical protein
MIHTLWHLYTQAVGIIAIVAAISFGVIRVMSNEGPVVKNIDGPFPISTKIPYKGVLSYRTFTRRLKSCDGNVLYTFIGDTPRVSVTITRPVVARDISPRTERIVRIELPDSITPGPWRFQSIIDSQCPTYSRQDVIAAFNIEVLNPNGE